MTEEKAKTKWCPHVRMSNDSDPDNTNHSYNRDSHGRLDKGCNCVASDCMMWREEEDQFLANIGGLGGSIIKGEGGYCGLPK